VVSLDHALTSSLWVSNGSAPNLPRLPAPKPSEMPLGGSRLLWKALAPAKIAREAPRGLVGSGISIPEARFSGLGFWEGGAQVSTGEHFPSPLLEAKRPGTISVRDDAGLPTNALKETEPAPLHHSRRGRRFAPTQ
jgi:hypothetical protein